MSKNTTEIKAAVVREKGGPFNIETLSLEGPRRDEVLVKVVATGLCHTDMVARDKGYPVPQPIVLGREGAGIVESVGADVLKVAPGDSVVLTFLTMRPLPYIGCTFGMGLRLKTTLLVPRPRAPCSLHQPWGFAEIKAGDRYSSRRTWKVFSWRVPVALITKFFSWRRVETNFRAR
jgi:Alcohol dehydrogenase GroES-like domain